VRLGGRYMQVRRNADRFPADFMLRLSAAEASALRSQIATSKEGVALCRSPSPTFVTQSL